MGYKRRGGHKLLTVEVDPGDLASFAAVCKAAGVSMSGAVRGLIAEAIAQNPDVIQEVKDAKRA